jgi:poly-gamma-glutamate capsule biosynthesis protein CapA/YwtB (metallophosphatase superfamily)
VIASIHWGGNWGYAVTSAQRNFAHALIDVAQVDIVHGHSSHHAKGIEVHRGRLILYGCGDFINDYEGIGGHEEFRADLGLMYFPTLDIKSGALARLTMTPTRVHQFRAIRTRLDEARWIASTLDRTCRLFGTGVQQSGDGELLLVH